MEQNIIRKAYRIAVAVVVSSARTRAAVRAVASAARVTVVVPVVMTSAVAVMSAVAARAVVNVPGSRLSPSSSTPDSTGKRKATAMRFTCGT